MGHSAVLKVSYKRSDSVTLFISYHSANKEELFAIETMSTEILRLTTLFVVLCGVVISAPLDEENEYSMAHEGNWLADHLLKNDYLNQLKRLPLASHHLYGYTGKRNSELSNSMMGLPLNMIDNGKK